MSISVFDLFKIGIGPSSSHTVGPMRAARSFVQGLADADFLDVTASVKVELFGSLGATGVGHGSNKAVMLGLEGERPEAVDVVRINERVQAIRERGQLSLLGVRAIPFDEGRHLILHRRRTLPFHPNGMRFSAADASSKERHAAIYYSVGGGFIVDEQEAGADRIKPDRIRLAHPFTTAERLLAICAETGLPISQVMRLNEVAWHDDDSIRSRLLEIWTVMQDCVASGCARDGMLPGGLKVRRRARALHEKLLNEQARSASDPLIVMDWVNLFALAVNEENAAGGRVVTAPTNGAAGIMPAVLHYYTRFVPGASDEGVIRFLLTAGAIGILFKENASISGAEVGCQGEVGSACSMAAAGLAEVLGGTPTQVENAAEIAMEHNLGLTCDPIGGLVQIPCIERNAMASVKAINAARMALCGDGQHFVSLDKVIRTMRDTGADMKEKYKETARGGLAINVLEVPVSIVDC